MTHLDTYRETFLFQRAPNAVEVRRAGGGASHRRWRAGFQRAYVHEQFVDPASRHFSVSDPDNRVVILTGSGDAFMETIAPDGFDFFAPRGYDKIYRGGQKSPDEHPGYSKCR